MLGVDRQGYGWGCEGQVSDLRDRSYLHASEIAIGIKAGVTVDGHAQRALARKRLREPTLMGIWATE